MLGTQGSGMQSWQSAHLPHALAVKAYVCAAFNTMPAGQLVPAGLSGREPMPALQSTAADASDHARSHAGTTSAMAPKRCHPVLQNYQGHAQGQCLVSEAGAEAGVRSCPHLTSDSSALNSTRSASCKPTLADQTTLHMLLPLASRSQASGPQAAALSSLLRAVRAGLHVRSVRQEQGGGQRHQAAAGDLPHGYGQRVGREMPPQHRRGHLRGLLQRLHHRRALGGASVQTLRPCLE